MNEIYLYTGSAIITIWGIAHLIPTKAIVKGFGDISADNRKIIAMESIAEGMTLCFLGILAILVTSLGDWQSQTASVVYYAIAVMLLVMAVLTLLTGARTSLLPYKICPFVKTLTALLIIIGAAL
jgi:hypothetical protein